jgi:hypothetical protein
MAWFLFQVADCGPAAAAECPWHRRRHGPEQCPLPWLDARPQLLRLKRAAVAQPLGARARAAVFFWAQLR